MFLLYAFLIHFNALSIIRKFNEIEKELALLYTYIIFITETLLSSYLACWYNLHGYNAFYSYRSDKTGDGTSIYIQNYLPAADL